ncbi:hypothetical protein SAMN05421770_101456 [Granulicella rosea]|uniref:Uncharacterized protein n=1 Tax=Granulicella rosea TaxID=474952 RepID=A0A239DFX5_9BACT|nr:hypothetical protein [Granulicella rosea]SNS31406.1 hypothetical protein SAMN05421770_101456 [Granulicella rosea]
MDTLLLFFVLCVVSVSMESFVPATKRNVVLLAFGGCLCLGPICLPAGAQEVIHTRTGQVTAVNARDKTLTLKVADGSTIVFHEVASPEPALSFAKPLRDKTVPVAGFSNVGSNVAVFYFGFDRPTAVAIKDFGPDPVKRTAGTVEGFDHHKHSLTLKTETPAPEQVMLTEDTIVDTDNGVVKLSDYKPSKGERLRCVTRAQSETALLVTPQ